MTRAVIFALMLVGCGAEEKQKEDMRDRVLYDCCLCLSETFRQPDMHPCLMVTVDQCLSDYSDATANTNGGCFAVCATCSRPAE